MIEHEKLREMQMKELELLKSFRDICKEEGICYYLIAGTAIGAIRHKGFIPWDDDIDVALKREDYLRFLEVAKKYLPEGQVLQHNSLNDSYTDVTAKLIDEKSFFRIRTNSDVTENNIWIDIFPLDGAPNNKIIRKLHFKHIYFLRMMMAYYYLDAIQYNEERSKWKKTLIQIAKKIPINKIINPVKIRRKIDKLLMKYPASKSKTLGNYYGAYQDREILPADVYGNGCEVVFEDDIYTVPAKYDAYLRNVYGDYMRLPPEEKRVPKHSVIDVISRE